MKPRKLGDLYKRQEEIKMLIAVYEGELKEIEDAISQITGEKHTHYKNVYDDENPDYIIGTENGI